MKTMHKLCAVSCVLVLGAAVAVPALTSHQVNEQLNAWALETSRTGDFQLRQLQHEAGFIASRGSAELVLRSRCSEDSDEQAGMVVQLSYEVRHVPGPGGINAFSWKAKPQGEAAEALKALFGTEDALSGQGNITWSGQVHSDLALPAMSLAQDGGTMEASASKGALTVGGKRVAFAWNVDDLQLRNASFVVRAQGLGLSIDFDNWHRGTGDAAFKIRKLSTRDATLEGLSIASSTRENAGRLDSVMRNHLDRLVTGDKELKSLAFDLGMKGLHAESVEKLTTLFSQSCGVQRMTQDERQTLRDAMRTLLSQGMTLQVEQLRGESSKGSLAGELTMALQPAPQSGAVQLAQLLTSKGRILLNGDMASPELQQMASTLGWGRVTQGALESSFHYEKGLLKVLDRSVDASAIQSMLAVADTVLLALLESRVPAVLASREDLPPSDAVETEETMALESVESEEVVEPESPEDATEVPE